MAEATPVCVDCSDTALAFTIEVDRTGSLDHSPFGANVTITNQAATAVNGWTLTVSWPEGGEAVQSGWNGTWTQSGHTVTVTNVSWNGTIAASGGSAGLGFNGTDSGQDPGPTAFYLTNAVCAMN